MKKTALKSDEEIIQANVSDVVVTDSVIVEVEKVNQMNFVYDRYFELKDALVKTDSKNASLKASDLLKVVKEVKMDELPMDVHMVWMKVMKSIQDDAIFIASSKDIEKQRNRFMSLTKSVYALIKVAHYEAPVYFQHCPMYNEGKDADWLSKENTIKNPYYGAQMLNCGKTTETIK